MKKTLSKEVEIPSGIDVSINEDKITVKGPNGEISREFKIGHLDMKKEGTQIVIGHKKATKNEKKMMNTIAAHIKNMIKGVQEKFSYKLKICFSHFPFTVNVEGNKCTIKNFLGEKVSRTFSFPEGVDVETGREFVTVASMNKELAGRVAASFERATKVRGRDRRVFQDGLFIVNKAGKEI